MTEETLKKAQELARERVKWKALTELDLKPNRDEVVSEVTIKLSRLRTGVLSDVAFPNIKSVEAEFLKDTEFAELIIEYAKKKVTDLTRQIKAL